MKSFTMRMLVGLILLTGCHHSKGLWTKDVYVPAPADVNMNWAYHVRGEICGTVGQNKITGEWTAYQGLHQLQGVATPDENSAKMAVEQACD
jgi:hypothetical protein